MHKRAENIASMGKIEYRENVFSLSKFIV